KLFELLHLWRPRVPRSCFQVTVSDKPSVHLALQKVYEILLCLIGAIHMSVGTPTPSGLAADYTTIYVPEWAIGRRADGVVQGLQWVRRIEERAGTVQLKPEQLPFLRRLCRDVSAIPVKDRNHDVIAPSLVLYAL